MEPPKQLDIPIQAGCQADDDVCSISVGEVGDDDSDGFSTPRGIDTPDHVFSTQHPNSPSRASSPPDSKPPRLFLLLTPSFSLPNPKSPATPRTLLGAVLGPNGEFIGVQSPDTPAPQLEPPSHSRDSHQRSLLNTFGHYLRADIRAKVDCAQATIKTLRHFVPPSSEKHQSTETEQTPPSQSTPAHAQSIPNLLPILYPTSHTFSFPHLSDIPVASLYCARPVHRASEILHQGFGRHPVLDRVRDQERLGGGLPLRKSERHVAMQRVADKRADMRMSRMGREARENVPLDSNNELQSGMRDNMPGLVCEGRETHHSHGVKGEKGDVEAVGDCAGMS